MTHDSAGLPNVPAPYLVDQGIVVKKSDMLRLLNDLGQVAYTDVQEKSVLSQGTGYVMDVFAEPEASTLVANQSLYLNVYSFDYIQLEKLPNEQACFKLFQDNRCLQLIPLTSPVKDQAKRDLDATTIEEIVAEALSASWDACLDDDGPLA
ncbi:MAG: hypothetical protein AAF892_09635 [Cyanobacteria bacterium P01_D01_bin.71]